MLHRNANEQRNIIIKMTRDSVSMGDDCMAPHEEEILFEASDTVYELMNRASSYVPPMRDYEWKVMCGAEVIGKLASGDEKKYKVTLERPNIKLSMLPEYEIFCRKCFKKENLSYFERIEVLYDGNYFSIDVFREYGDIKTILEKGATKLTTDDKEFALKHEFSHRELQSYDKVLKINEFEGLRIVRVPNSLDVATEYIEIPKDKVVEELERRAGITRANSVTEQLKVANFCPVCGKKNNGGKYCSECGTGLIVSK